MDPTAAETIQTTAKILVAAPVMQLARRFLENIGDPLTKEIGENLRDQYRDWKAHNAHATAQTAAAKLEARGVEGDVPKAFLFPALEGAANVDAPELQELWAELIANGVADEAHRHPLFLQALASLDVADALYFAERVHDDVRLDYFSAHPFEPDAADLMRCDHLLAASLIEPREGEFRLPRLSNIQRYSEAEITRMVESALNDPDRTGKYVVSSFGESFARAVGLLPSLRPCPRCAHQIQSAAEICWVCKHTVIPA